MPPRIEAEEYIITLKGQPLSLVKSALTLAVSLHLIENARLSRISHHTQLANGKELNL
jgi:hypothetical protein